MAGYLIHKKYPWIKYMVVYAQLIDDGYLMLYKLWPWRLFNKKISVKGGYCKNMSALLEKFPDFYFSDTMCIS